MTPFVLSETVYGSIKLFLFDCTGLFIKRQLGFSGYALLVLFFVVGVVKTCGSLTEVKKPEHALKLFIRFALAKNIITYGLELMLKLMVIVQGVISKIMTASGIAGSSSTALPQSIIDAIEDCGFWESIPLWAVTLIGGLFITVLSFIMIMSVYGRFFKIYMYSAIAPVALYTFAGQPTENVGKTFLKSYCAVRFARRFNHILKIF